MSFLQNSIYPNLPVPLQNVAISAFGLSWHNRRFGGCFKESYKGFVNREKYSVEQWKEYQAQQMQKLLRHAYEKVPYYRYILKKAGFNKAKLSHFQLDQLNQVEILEKEVLRKRGKKELLAIEQEKGGSFYSSSGSTGTPTNILYSHAMHQRLSALYEARVRNWAGVSKLDSRGMLGGRRVLPEGLASAPYYRYNFIESQVYFSTYHISPSTVKNYVDGLKKYKPNYMVGYAMSNYILARFIKEANLKAPAMKAVLTSSEKLTPAMRSMISEVYDCKVYDAWSGVEWCGLISENEYGQLLISPDSAYIEVLKPDGTEAGPGEEGELICTGFLNYDQPLIRYRIGDVVRLAKDQQTKCGRNFIVIDEIIGRTEDTVIGKDGREMVRFHGIFVDLENVVKAQIIQEEIDTFTVNVLTKGLLQAEKEIIIKRMNSQLGEVVVNINEVDDIPVGANGKFKAVISKVKRDHVE
jgi:phenylacetate-CoA ligase